VRRKPGTLVPLEADILAAGLELRRAGEAHFHGFQLAQEIADHGRARKLTAHGTLYKALGRLEEAGLLASEWEDPEPAAVEGRPRRRLYEVTGAGERALAAWHAAHPQRLRSRPRPGLEPS
jgi:PadR family transcriptional regulator, regulatory protein PadR